MPNNNIYATPKANLSNHNSADVNYLCKMARAHQMLLRTLMVSLILFFSSPLLAEVLPSFLIESGVYSISIGLLFLGLGIALCALAVRLSLIISNIPMAIVTGLCMLFPFINLLVILALSDRTQRKLKHYGIKMGFLGVSAKTVRQALANNT